MITRRSLLRFAAGAAALPAAPPFAAAQAYPSRPVRLLVGFGPGGAPDILARLIGQWLSERLGQSFVVENRPGASSSIATETVIHAPADGYTLLLASLANAVNATLYPNLSYDFIRDTMPVGGISREPMCMEVNPSFPATTVPEFIAYAKANPGKLSMASAGIGTTLHMAGELFMFMTGITMVHVPYRSSAAALTDLLAGRVQVIFSPLPSSIEYVRSDKLRALAVTGGTRSAALPNVPTVGEAVPGYEANGFYGISAAAQIPADIVERLNTEINAGLADPQLKMRFAELGSVPTPAPPATFGQYIAEETEKWGKVIRAANIKPE
jgi:tripartite-type tricarboxylate transporter receptor subunit TctC